jgi:signal transduction histidine kinase
VSHLESACQAAVPASGEQYVWRRRRIYAEGTTTGPGDGRTVGDVRRLPSLPLVAQAVAVGFVQIAGSMGASENQLDRRPLDWLAVVLLLVGPVALLGRERRPHLVAVACVGATAIFLARGHAYGPVFLAPMLALFVAGLTPRRVATWAVGAAGVGALLVAETLEGDVEWLHIALSMAWLAAVLAVAEVVRVRRDQAAERQRTSADEQRLRIARELHDVLAHNISMINVQAGVALHLIDEQPEQARTALANIKEASRDALQELRSALELLRRDGAAPLAPAPRLAELGALVEGVGAGGLDVVLDLPPVPPLPAAAELAAYRIVQEALTNATRHAAAARVVVRLSFSDEVAVEVPDDGVGGAAALGNGIRGMQDRAAGLGGSLTAGAGPGGGFRVAARLPVAP